MAMKEPIIKKIPDNIDKLNSFKEEILDIKDEKIKDIIMNFPTVYIHNWKSKGSNEVYVGETNNIIRRTHEHYAKMSDKNVWEHNLANKDADLYIIAHEHFNKSITLDIENKLIHYLTSADNVSKVHNGRSNPQNKYYPYELDSIFPKIWRKLMKENKELFPLESSIKDSAIFKASPLHKLTEEQQEAKGKIMEKVVNALKNDKRGQLIFVEGEAGTGKTVLNSSTSYELICKYEESKEDVGKILKDEKLKCYLVVNHKEQLTVYNQIIDKLGITDVYGKVVYKPTRFINTHSEDDPVDIVFIDEGHLLLTQGKQSYRGKNQLQDIINRAKVVVVMFDKDQILTTEQYWEDEQIEKYKNEAIKNDNYIKLENQLRINASEDFMEWLSLFTKEGVVNMIPKDLGGYDIRIFDSPEKLEKEIRKKASKEKSKLSRLIATYDWEYNEDKRPESSQYWEVRIGQWSKPWNRELARDLNRGQKRKIEKLSWAEQPQTVDEVGSTFTIQGFDLSYSGLIIGPSVKYRNGHIVFDPNESCNEKAVRNRTLSNGTKKKFGEKLLKHELRVLMTRGVNGLYIYACDDELRQRLKECRYK